MSDEFHSKKIKKLQRILKKLESLDSLQRPGERPVDSEIKLLNLIERRVNNVIKTNNLMVDAYNAQVARFDALVNKISHTLITRSYYRLYSTLVGKRSSEQLYYERSLRNILRDQYNRDLFVYILRSRGVSKGSGVPPPNFHVIDRQLKHLRATAHGSPAKFKIRNRSVSNSQSKVRMESPNIGLSSNSFQQQRLSDRESRLDDGVVNLSSSSESSGSDIFEVLSKRKKTPMSDRRRGKSLMLQKTQSVASLLRPKRKDLFSKDGSAKKKKRENSPRLKKMSVPRKKRRLKYKYSRGFISLESILKYHSKIFLEFARQQASEENVAFFLQVNAYKKAIKRKDYDKSMELAKSIYDAYISHDASTPINISTRTREELLAQLHEMFESKSTKKYRQVFDSAQQEILQLLEGDVFSRFVNSEIYDTLMEYSSSSKN